MAERKTSPTDAASRQETKLSEDARHAANGARAEATTDAGRSGAYLSLKQRLIALFIYGAGLYFIGAMATGLWLPTGGGHWVWWGSAIALYLVTTLQAPFFHRPRDVLANAVISAFMLFTIGLSEVQLFRAELEWFRWIALGFVILAGACAVVSIAFQDVPQSDSTWRGRVKPVAYRFATSLGNGVVMFTPPALISIFGFHQQQPIAMLWLAALWVLVVSVKPVELGIEAWNLLRRAAIDKAAPEYVGRVTRIDDPNIVRVNLASPASWTPDRLHTARLPGDRYVGVIPLFVQTQDNELIGTGICFDEPANDSIAPGHVWTTGGVSAEEALQRLAGTESKCHLIGFVVEESNISPIRFEIASAQPIKEGTVVFVRDRGQTIYYQILDAATKEEVFTQNPRGTHIVKASQLGTLEDGAFKKYGWVPPMNAPVFLPEKIAPAGPASDGAADEFTLGDVAKTGLTVKAALCDMAEYHTAVLGVTGTGKTELVLDVIKAHLKANRKVFCVDFTGEYKPRLNGHNPQSLELDAANAKKLDDLVTAIEYGQYKSETEKKALDDWMNSTRPGVEKQIATFLESEGASVGIFELPDIANTRATLRATELYLSAIFAWARKYRKARDILIVLEEAHTVIPETVMFGFDKGETQAVVARMSQIALQGRKYGVGLMLVSQRTALVSKTLLSQCNTCVCFAMYDKTGLDYLASVFASDHVRAIPNLRFLQGIAFGKAIKSDRPIIFEIPFDQAKKDASEALNRQLPAT